MDNSERRIQHVNTQQIATLALRMVGEMDIFDDVERSRTLLRTALELEYALTALRGASLQVLKQVPRTTP